MPSRFSDQIILAAIFALIAVAPAAAQAPQVQIPAESEWPKVMPPRGGVPGEETDRIVKVTENIYLAVVGGQNLVVSVGEDGLLLSDDQDVPLVPRVLKQLAKISPKPVRYIVNSHWHFDHVGGNDYFGRSGAVTIAQENTRKRMMTEIYNPISDRRQEAFPQSYLPKLTFADEIALHINGDDIVIAHMPPAHTDSDVDIYFRKANVIALNDLFFVGENYPSIENETGASIKGMIAAFDKVLTAIDVNTIVIPSRGPLARKSDVAEFRSVLITVRDRIIAMVKKGKSESDVLAAKPTKDFDARWAKDQGRTDMFVKAIYFEYKNAR